MDDLPTFDALAAELGDDLARRLMVHAHHTDPAGNPVLERHRVPDLIQLLRMEVDTHD